MKLVVFGAGHIGLTTSLCFAELGHQVLSVDVDTAKIQKLNDGLSEVYEPGLGELLKTQLSAGTIHFTTDAAKAIEFSDIIFIAVGTPTDSNGNCDLQFVLQVVNSIAFHAKTPKNIVIKSTVPAGTNLKLTKEFSHKKLQFISNPEFIREGCALNDCRKPDRAVVGTLGGENSIQLLRELYQPFLSRGADFLVMDPTSAELTKYAANTMLASRISLMNEFSQICEEVGADIDCLRIGIGADPRIGSQFLKAGIGYGGSCFPKDIDALIQMAASQNISVPMTKAIRTANQSQLNSFAEKIKSYFLGKESEKIICLWGASFKPETNDLREAPALKLVQLLLDDGFKIQIFDPVSANQLEQIFKMNDLVKIYDNQYSALIDSYALIVATEWPQFIGADLVQIKNNLRSPVIFDGRNIFTKSQMENNQFKHFPIGRTP